MTDIAATLIPPDHKIYKHFTAFTEAYLIGEEQFCYTKNGPQILKIIQNFKVRDDDVYVLSYPKTGTTWLQEIVYTLMINVDFEKAKGNIRDNILPYADNNTWERPAPNSVEIANNSPSPRLIKFHSHLSFLPTDIFTKGCKVFYICRNMKDTIVSFYHFSRAITAAVFRGNIEDFAELFMANKVPFAPYITHVKQFWEKRHERNVYFTTYEKLKKNQKKVITEIARFLDKEITEEQIRMLDEHCKFSNMKANPTVNRTHWTENVLHDKDFQFMRKGIVGSYKTEISPELIAKIDKWTIENTTDCPELRDILLDCSDK